MINIKNSKKNIEVVWMLIDINKYTGVQAFYKNSPTQTILLPANKFQGVEILFYEDYLQINDYILYFDDAKKENLFIDEIFFVIECENNVSQNQRITENKRILSEDDIVEYYKNKKVK